MSTKTSKFIQLIKIDATQQNILNTAYIIHTCRWGTVQPNSVVFARVLKQMKCVASVSSQWQLKC